MLVPEIQEGGELLGAELPYPNGYVLAEYKVEELLLLGVELRANGTTCLISTGLALNWGSRE